MQAVILAAGRGTRLGDPGKDTPKGLLEVGGRALLERSLDALRSRGFDRITIVTGHLEEQIRQRLAADDVTFVTNERYAETGSADSLLVALKAVDAPFLLLESDLIYDPTLLDALDFEGSQMIVVDASGSGDEVWVYPDEKGNISGLGKNLVSADGKSPVGELAGITWLTRDLVEEFERQMAAGTEDHYETVLCRAYVNDVFMKLVHVPGRVWREVDTQNDLVAAEEIAARL